MRIGVDLLPLQSPGSSGRGVGRLSGELLRRLVGGASGVEYILLRHGSLPMPEAVGLEGCRVVTVEAPAREDVHGIHPALQMIVDGNGLKLDAYLNLNPFEACPGHDLPRKPVAGPRMISLVHDLIPLSDQERYLGNPDDAAWYRNRCRTLRGYDLLLTNSEATRGDCIRRLGMQGERVATIGAGADLGTFRPASGLEEKQEDERIVRGLGFEGPFFFHLGGMDERKNLPGLLRGMGASGIHTRRLVVVGRSTAEYRRQAEQWAAEAGLGGAIAWTSKVSDRELVALYRECLAFVLVSFAEGFGLPLVEAMASGAAVIAGEDAAQAEVVGDAGQVVAPSNPAAIGDAMRRIEADAGLRLAFSSKASERARRFAWADVAGRADLAIRGVVGGRRRRGECIRRVAMFSPYPGKGSGIADYAARLAGAMTPALAVDLYHDHDYVPESQFKASRFPCHDYRLYPMMAARASYRGVIHHMGNSWYHKFIYEAILRNPGIVVLHDLHLAGFHWWYGSLAGAEHDHFIAELERDDPAGLTRWSGELEAWKGEEGGIQGAAARRGLYMSRSVLERASRLVVHSGWARNALAGRHPDLAGKVVEVPLGAEGFEPSPGMRTETRRRFGLSADGLVIGCFGILTRNKMDEELLEAFASAGPELEGATLVFAGKDWEEGAARRKAEGLGLGSRVRFLGRVDGGDYEALLGAVDLAVSLRRPPTFGESSASLLDCLRAGIPTIINDAGTLAEVPQGVTWKIRWEAEGVAGLAGAIRVLAGDPGRRAALGAAARQHVERKHNWRRVAGLYEQLIEEEWGRNQRARAAG